MRAQARPRALVALAQVLDLLHVARVHTFLIWQVHTLSISDGRVDTCALSPSSEWLAFGCAALGQLLVWEWRAESYVLRQQGHFYAEVQCTPSFHPPDRSC